MEKKNFNWALFVGLLGIAICLLFGLRGFYAPINNLSQDVRNLSGGMGVLSSEMKRLSDETEGIVSKMDELSRNLESIERGMEDFPTRIDLWTTAQFLSERPLEETTLREWFEAKRFAGKIDRYLLERPTE